jgi:hypothetical protein
MKITYIKPLLIPAMIIVLLGLILGKINWWIAIPLLCLCVDIKINFDK